MALASWLPIVRSVSVATPSGSVVSSDEPEAQPPDRVLAGRERDLDGGLVVDVRVLDRGLVGGEAGVADDPVTALPGRTVDGDRRVGRIRGVEDDRERRVDDPVDPDLALDRAGDGVRRGELAVLPEQGRLSPVDDVEHREREGDDPADHDDEDEQVVALPRGGRVGDRSDDGVPDRLEPDDEDDRQEDGDEGEVVPEPAVGTGAPERSGRRSRRGGGGPRSTGARRADGTLLGPPPHGMWKRQPDRSRRPAVRRPENV